MTMCKQGYTLQSLVANIAKHILEIYINIFPKQAQIFLQNRIYIVWHTYNQDH